MNRGNSRLVLVPTKKNATSLLNFIIRSLKRELVRAQEEIKRIQSVPLVIGQFMEAIDQKCSKPYGLLVVISRLT